MNKDLLDQVPAEEQPTASKIKSIVDDMQPSQAFQWELENQLMDKATKPPSQGRFTKILIPLGWTIAALGGVLLLNWVVRSLVPQPSPAAGPTATHEISFVESVRSGSICMGPLAVGHGFSVFLSNPEKTELAVVDPENTIGELRSFTWSIDGEQLAIVGNSLGGGNIYLTNPGDMQPQPVLANGEAGYFMEAAWSRNGEQLLMWSSQNNRVLYLMNADGTGLVEKQSNVQILGTPQFWPDGLSVVFYGADKNSAGLFEMVLVDSEVRLIESSVQYPGSYAFSPDGSYLAYMEYDREIGEARLVLEDLMASEIEYLGALPIPKGAGASVPETANLSWSADGKSLVFDFGRNATDRAVYLAHVDGSGLVKVADAAYAPSISADGKCLAYISNNQVFLLDLTEAPANLTAVEPVLLADLPRGRGPSNTKQDKLQWSPKITP